MCKDNSQDKHLLWLCTQQKQQVTSILYKDTFSPILYLYVLVWIFFFNIKGFFIVINVFVAFVVLVKSTSIQFGKNWK